MYVLYVLYVCEEACVAGGAGPRGGDAGQVPAVEGVRGAGEAGAHGSGYGARVFIYTVCLIYTYIRPYNESEFYLRSGCAHSLQTYNV